MNYVEERYLVSLKYPRNEKPIITTNIKDSSINKVSFQVVDENGISVNESRRPSLESILYTCANVWNTPIHDVKSKNKSYRLVFVRFMYSYIAYRCNYRSEEIVKHIGKNRSMVTYYVKAFYNELDTNKEFIEKYIEAAYILDLKEESLWKKTKNLRLWNALVEKNRQIRMDAIM